MYLNLFIKYFANVMFEYEIKQIWKLNRINQLIKELLKISQKVYWLKMMKRKK